MDTALRELLTDWITLERYTGQDTFGNDTYGGEQEFNCRVDTFVRNDQSFDAQGRRNPAPAIQASVILDTISPSPAVLDRVTVNDETLYITAVDAFTDERGPHHIVLSCASKAVQ